MLMNFDKDLAKGKKGEQIVKKVFSERDKNHQYIDVSNDPKYYYKGDLIAVAADGKKTMVEVKNDGVIHKTHNILCEEAVFMKQKGKFNKGFMYSDYELFCVLSEPERKIYMVDFQILKQIYKQGRYKRFDYPDQYSDCYLLPIGTLKQYGGLINVVSY